jgi:hypothetical protein
MKWSHHLSRRKIVGIANSGNNYHINSPTTTISIHIKDGRYLIRELTKARSRFTRSETYYYSHVPQSSIAKSM